MENNHKNKNHIFKHITEKHSFITLGKWNTFNNSWSTLQLAQNKIKQKYIINFFQKGPIFISVWIGLFILSCLITGNLIKKNVEIVWIVITTIISVLQLSSYLITALADPGYAQQNDQETQYVIEKMQQVVNFQVRECNVCNIYKDIYTEHCEICNICVRNFNHHCPWIGKCIGKGNKNYFKFFINMTQIYIIYSIAITIYTIKETKENGINIQSMNL
ncbi:hypothetical protein IMG5_029920 [Ichthyophthirius multifiliis]|uniref:Palmitoyltransferase n=1 Tax=Ichthyophthirius multifiliis TaxID=5932 RepID=G0QLF5_ICHMU|nr:hypothetical protein IMG5_029920 [Ichthyophthirius multifiliis]EGR33949.1 hypothetical protein IMG5_029920 [Ichthyophthirius multifiliis]|eukprot:XP_004039253.1 hypothetical protein IMG5_029920 [Ichthyophthirius multifiliis]